MQGAGNDYVYVDCFHEPVPPDPAGLARRIADRHFGVGGDGLILIRPSAVADARMQMFNADGSEAQMCGNGIRCVAKYLFDHGICRRTRLTIDSGAGVLNLDLEILSGLVQRVCVDMGEPILAAERIPTTLPGDAARPGQPVVGAKLVVDGVALEVTCVSMGNPHCITYVDRLGDDWVLGTGPKIETDPHFPQRINAEFVEVVSPTEVRMRVWERGSGETLACGTGATAVCVAGVLTGRTGRKVLVHLPGGDLELDWNSENNHVYMTGPAVEVFSGEWPWPH
jgi:diaminopimelate epimerase